jgi:hypothetical protein
MANNLNLKQRLLIPTTLFGEDMLHCEFREMKFLSQKNSDWIMAKVKYVSGDKVFLDLPIDRYYMEEKSAPAAERVYRQFAQRNKQDAYIVVRIKDGFAVIESLYVGGQKIEDAVRANTKLKVNE